MLKVAQISDVQVRNFHRHDEFRESFNNLYESLKEQCVDLIVIPGDIAHTKTKISPEFVQICSDFFTALANIAPLVIIPGNHDGNLNNLTRLDALTPIVAALSHPRIYYFKNSGVYRIPEGFVDSDVSVVVFSCFDDSWPTREDVENHIGFNDELILGLYHGFVEGAELQNGQIVVDCPYKTRQFLKIVDYLMLGDIHKMQILDGAYRAAYCGSLVQQNYGESVSKGYLLWNIESKDKHEVDFIELPNVCPYYTVRLEDDLKIPELDLQKKARIRIFCRQLTVFENKSLRDSFNYLHEPTRIDIIDDVNAHRQGIKIDSVDTTIENIRDVGTQEKLIRGFLKQYNLEDGLISKVLEINRRYNAHAQKEDDTLRNIQYRINKVKWDNLLSYGEGNELNLSQFPGLVGVFGKSAVGKSSAVVDIPLYCIFNKVSKKVTKNDWLINEKKEMGMAEIEIFIDKDRHRIKRTTGTYIKSGKKNSKPVVQGVTSVEYSIIHSDGTTTERTGEEPRVTNAIIKKVFGTAEDFMATSVAPQWQLINFIETGSTERQRLIGRYFDVDIFNKKHDLAKEELKDTKASLKLFENKNFDIEIEVSEKKYSKIQESLFKQEKSQKDQEIVLKTLRERLVALHKELLPIKVDLDLTEEILDRQIQVVKVECINKKSEIDNIEADIKVSRNNVRDLKEKVKELDAFEVEKVKLIKLSEGVSDDTSELGAMVGTLVRVGKKIDELQSYTCVKNSDCCMLEELNSLKSERNDLEEKKKQVFVRVNEKTPHVDALVKLQIKIDELNQTKNKSLVEESVLGERKEKLNAVSAVFDQLVDKIKALEVVKKNWLENQEQIKANKEVSARINETEWRIKKVGEALKGVRESFVSLSKEFGIAEAKYNALMAEKADYEALKDDYEAYDYFMRAMSKDGISRKIISDNLGVINAEIQKILSNTNFTVELVSEQNGKAVEIYFVPEEGKKRNIVLASGMEKTFSALLIRCALISITTLPRSNVLVLDECFGALDETWLEVMVKILESLKKYFETIIVVTHNDVLKDFMDHVLTIERDDQGFSRIL